MITAAPMTIYPALDLLDGRAVRITRNADGQTVVADDDPIALARRWQAAGATWLHVVDLDGAREGGVRHAETLRAIADATGLRMQVGGGVRSEDDVATAFAAGASRVTLATAAVRDAAEGEATLAACLTRWGDAIAVSVDAHDGQITVGGWLPWATGRATDFAQAMARLGVRTLIVTNLGSDGSLEPGMDGAYALLTELRAALPEIALIAAGGVATLDDLRRLAALGVAGVVVGRALYDGAFDLADALAVAAAPPTPELLGAPFASAPSSAATESQAAHDDAIGDMAAADTIETPAITPFVADIGGTLSDALPAAPTTGASPSTATRADGGTDGAIATDRPDVDEPDGQDGTTEPNGTDGERVG